MQSNHCREKKKREIMHAKCFEGLKEIQNVSYRIVTTVLSCGDFIDWGHFPGLPEATLEKIQGIDRHAEKNARVSQELLSVNLWRILILHWIAVGNFHCGHRSTPCGFPHFQMPPLNGDGESATAWGAPTSNAKTSMDRPGQIETAFPSHPIWN